MSPLHRKRFGRQATGWVVLATLGVLQQHAGAQMTQAEAFAAGNSSGKTANTASYPTTVNVSRAKEVLKHYSDTNTQSTYYDNGNGNTKAPGITKSNACASGTGATDSESIQECNAVNYLRDLPTQKPDLGITRDDPLIVKSKEIQNNPEAIAENLGATYSACKTVVTNEAGRTTYENCYDYLGTEDGVCHINRIVSVAVDRTYECLKEDMTVQTQTCNRAISAILGSAVDFYFASTCSLIDFIGCPTSSQTDAQWNATLNAVNAAIANGGTTIFINGAAWATVPAGTVFHKATFSGRGGWMCTGNCLGRICDVLNIVIGGNNVRYGGTILSGSATQFGYWGRGTSLSVCGPAQCQALQRMCTEEGICNYTCNGTFLTSQCPSGYSPQVDGSGVKFCREDTYTGLNTDPNCAYLGAAPVEIIGTGPATQYKWACKKVTNGCADIEARAQ